MSTGPKNALACARRGWYVSPLPPGKKFEPLAGYNDTPTTASIDPAQIVRWFNSHGQTRNWALIPGPSGLLLLDVDNKPEKNGLESLAALTDEYGPLPPTFTVRTPSGGRHYYLRGHHVFKLNFGKSRGLPGLDCPQYVVAPGGTFEGGRYTVLHNLPVADVPNWLPLVIGEKSDAPDVEQEPATELDTPCNVQHAIYYLTHDAPPSIAYSKEGGNNTLLMVAVWLKDHGISNYAAKLLLAEHYNVDAAKPGEPYHPFCDPLWDADELGKVVDNAWTYLRQTQPGADTPEVAFADFDPVEDAKDCERMVKLHRDTMRRQYRAAARIPNEDRES
jgi:hypothetical protein